MVLVSAFSLYLLDQAPSSYSNWSSYPFVESFLQHIGFIELFTLHLCYRHFGLVSLIIIVAAAAVVMLNHVI